MPDLEISSLPPDVSSHPTRADVPKTYGSVTERLLRLKIGGTCVVTQSRVDYETARKYAPDRDWLAERREGGWLVTRVR